MKIQFVSGIYSTSEYIYKKIIKCKKWHCIAFLLLKIYLNYIEIANIKLAFENCKQELNMPLCLLILCYIDYGHMSLFKTAHTITPPR